MKKNGSSALASGRIELDAEYNHEICGERFYTFPIKCTRLSGAEDIFPVLVPGRMGVVERCQTGAYVTVSGQIRTFNSNENGVNRTKVYLFATSVEFKKDEKNWDENCIYLDGYICKKPSYRRTPAGREIADVVLAINRSYRKSDYIPCICWGRNARYVSTLEVGEHVQVQGRFQSRTYIKKFGDGIDEVKTAYEVSISKIECIEEEASQRVD